MSSPCGDVGTIDDTNVLWRRVQDRLDYLWWDRQAEVWRVRPKPPALQFNEALSTAWAEHLVATHGLGADAALDPEGRYTLVYALTAGDARALNCEVSHSPTGTTPPECGHASIDWPPLVDKALKAEIRDGLSLAMHLVFGASQLEPPPGA